MTGDEQRAARQKQYDEDAAKQAEWERRAHADAAEWRERTVPSSSRT